MTDTAAYGAWLRSCRRAAGLSQEELAEQAGLSVRAIRNFERGRIEHPHPGSLQRLADALALHGQARAEFFTAAGRGRSRAAAIATMPGEPMPQAGMWPVVPRQLPARVRQFAGRRSELAALTGLLDRAGTGAPAALVISAIGGTAGVGKTALAVHWAHQVAGRFRDGQLYVNLRGFAPSGPPMSPAEAIRGFLDAMGVPAERIPVGVDAQAGLYRSLLAGKQMLVVLDNARDTGQVRPLLPGSPGCLVVITSRSQLPGLVAAEGAQPVALDVLPEAEARELLARRLGTERVAAELDAVADLISLCGQLPLALAITAARAAAHPSFSLAGLAAELRDATARLDMLTAEDPTTSLAAVFSWSYDRLPGPAARMFRLLGLHPGADVPAPAAASMIDVPIAQARDLLGELARASLLAEHVPGRYDFHDLMRVYAVQQAEAHESAQTRRHALTRLFDYYLAATDAAMSTLAPGDRHRWPKVSMPETCPPRGTLQAARTWLDTERGTLVAIARYAADHGWPGHTTRLAVILFRYLGHGAYYSDILAINAAALHAAQLIGDRAAQADALRSRCGVDYWQGRYESAGEQLCKALAIYRELGDRYGQARTLNNLGLVLWRQGSYQQAISHHQQALALSLQAADKFGQALASDGLCLALCQQGHYQQAADHAQRALTIYSELDDPSAQARALHNLGMVLSGRAGSTRLPTATRGP